MHIRFIRSQALSALKKLQPALPRDNLIPQLSGIHLEADAERKEVTATARSTALAARISFPSKVEEAGSAVINGTLLCQLMEKFSGDDVDIQTVPSENAVLRSGRATFTLATLPSASYPQPVFQDPHAAITITNFPQLVRRTAFALMQNSSEKPAYGCIRLNVANSRAIATTTDLEGLTQVAVPVTMEEFSAEDAPMFLIPSYAAKYVSSVLDAKEALTIGITDHELIFSAHGLLASCPACKAEFLDPSMSLQRLKPCYSALVEREDFCNALHSLTVSAKDPRATVDLGLTDDSLTLKCADLFSRTSTNIAATAARPTPHVFYYREDILEKAVQTLQGSVIRVGIDQNGALLLRTKEQLYVQMPRTRAFIPSETDVKKKGSPKPAQAKRTGAKRKAA